MDLISRQMIGSQMWLEPDDSEERVDRLFAIANETGMGQIRIFLMWPWIEREPDDWNFNVFDLAFDAAERYGIRIKATLTANSGPWHIGTPSMLHSHTGFLSPEQREPARRYILQCVKRYKDHPALGQWILWNEPTGGADRTKESLEHWQVWLEAYYNHDLSALNNRWLTGFKSFVEIPFPEDVPHPVHRHRTWNSYGPWLLDWESRAAWLNSELKWVLDVVREEDKITETCVNPVTFLNNLAVEGLHIDNIARMVDVIGASYHPASHFHFADRALFPALMASGITKQANIPSVARVEVTEVQTGNTFNSSRRPSDVTPNEIAKFYLAPLAAGAEAVIGWCFNTRSQDNEAGDWGLLDNMDRPSIRSKMLRRVHDQLVFAQNHTGKWKPIQANAWVGYEPNAQAIEWIEAKNVVPIPGRLEHDSAYGSSILSALMMQCGYRTALTNIQDFPNFTAGSNGDLLVLSQVVAWNKDEADRLLTFAHNGGTLLIDATCGRKDFNATLHRPWPGYLANGIGMTAVGLQSDPNGYEIVLHGLPAGSTVLTRLDAEFDKDEGWRPWSEIRYAKDGEPLVWERAFGKGRIIICRSILGPSLVHRRDCMGAVKYLLQRAGTNLSRDVYPLVSEENTFAIPVGVERGTLTAVFGPDVHERQGKSMWLKANPGEYMDLWTGETVHVPFSGELALHAPEGISLMWRS